MTVVVDDIINSVATTLLDTAHRGWPRSELVGYINEALAATAGAKPDFYTVEQDISMVAGITQALPEGGLSIFNVSKNVVSSRVVTQVDGALLDEANRWWPAATQEVDVEHFTADPRDPRRFSITPSMASSRAAARIASSSARLCVSITALRSKRWGSSRGTNCSRSARRCSHACSRRSSPSRINAS